MLVYFPLAWPSKVEPVLLPFLFPSVQRVGPLEILGTGILLFSLENELYVNLDRKWNPVIHAGSKYNLRSFKLGHLIQNSCWLWRNAICDSSFCNRKTIPCIKYLLEWMDAGCFLYHTESCKFLRILVPSVVVLEQGSWLLLFATPVLKKDTFNNSLWDSSI